MLCGLTIWADRFRAELFGFYILATHLNCRCGLSVIGPTAGMLINCSTRSISKGSHSSERTNAISVLCRRTTVSRHSHSSEASHSLISGFVASSSRKQPALCRLCLL